MGQCPQKTNDMLRFKVLVQMRMPFIAVLFLVTAANALAEERTFRSGNRLYTFDFSAELIFKLREKPMDGFTSWEFTTDDWVMKSKRGAALAIHETLEPYDVFLAHWRRIPADERGRLEEREAYAILYTKEGRFLSMIARSTCEKPCHLFILVGAAADRQSLVEDTVARFRKTIEAGNYVKNSD